MNTQFFAMSHEITNRLSYIKQTPEPHWQSRSGIRNTPWYFPRTIAVLETEALAPSRRDFEQKRSSRNLASLWISTGASLSSLLHLHLRHAFASSDGTLVKFVAAVSRRSWHKSVRTTSRKAFSYVCRIGVSFDASGSPLTRSAGCHPHLIHSTRLSHPPFTIPFVLFRATARALLFCASRSPDEW